MNWIERYFIKRKSLANSNFFSILCPRFSVLFLLLLFSFKLNAQNYPVQVSVVTSGPFYNYLTYYADANKHLQFIVTLTDFNSGPVNARLRLKMTGNGYSLQTNPNFPVGPVFTLTPGIPVFINGDDLLPYFQNNNLIKSPSALDLNNLPFGLTTICAEVVKVGVGNEVLATNNCSAFMLNSFQPAVSTQPWCNGNIDPATNPFISFQWTQPIGFTPSIGNDLTYKFRLYEWIDTTNYSVFQGLQGLVYEEVTSVPLVNFSTFNYPLQVGKKYIWRTQAQVTSNGILVNMFDNQGYSAPCSFRFGQAVSLAQQLAAGLQISLTASANSPVRGKAQWTVTQTNPTGGGLTTYNSYLLDYRKKPTGNQGYTIPWFTDSTAASFLDLFQLEDSTTYEVKIRGRVGNYTSSYSNVVEFTTPPQRIYACGEADLPILPPVYNPLIVANVGMTVRIGQFDLTFSEVTPTGTPGHFAGKGLVPIDFIGGAKAKVSFTDLKIDNQFNVHAGTAEVVTDGVDSWLNQQYMQFIDPIYVTGTIDSAYADTAAGLAWIVVNGVATSYAFNPPDYPIIIRDDSGMQYTINPNGTVTVTSYLQYSNDHLDVGALAAVVFQQNNNETFGFDAKEHSAWVEQYELIRLTDSTNYFVANKSIGVDTFDVVDFTFNDSLWDATDFTYQLNGALITPSTVVSGNKITLTLPAIASSGKSTLYVMAGTLKIGKLNLQVYSKKVKEVVIIPLVSNYSFSKTAIETALDQTFGEANINVNVTLTAQWNNALFTTSNAIDVPSDVGMLNKYSDEMRDLRDAYFEDTTAIYKEKAYYIFVVPSFSDANLDGYMVRGKGLGFVSAGATAITYAHELGHGIGGLNHSWKENGPEEGATNNLMDYSSNAKELTLDQWKELRDKDVFPSFWDEAEDAASLITESIICPDFPPVSVTNYHQDIHVYEFAYFNGARFKLPQNSEVVSLAKIGNFYTVYSFKFNGNIYNANNPSKCEYVLQGTNTPINIGVVRENWDLVYTPTASQQISNDNVGTQHYYFVKFGDSVELRMSRMYIAETSTGWQFIPKVHHWNRGYLKLKANCNNNSLTSTQLQFANKYNFLKKSGDHVRVYENGQMVTYNSDGTVKVTAMTQVQFNQKLANLKSGQLHDGVATIYEKTSSGYKVHLNYGKDVQVKAGYEENGTAKDKSEQLIEEKLNALLANVPDLEVLRQGAQSGVFNDGKKIIIKDLPWYEFAYEIIGAGRQFLRDAKISESYWNSANSNYTQNWLNTPPYVTGVGNGIIEEIKSVPLLIDFGIEIATNEPLRTKTWNSIKDLSWQDIKDGLYNLVNSTIDTLSAGNDNSWHSGGKITVELISTAMGVGFIKKGTETTKDVVSKNIDDIAEELGERAVLKSLDDLIGFLGKSLADKKKHISDVWSTKFPFQELMEGRSFFEDVMGHFRYTKASGWLHTGDISEFFKGVDFYKGTTQGANIFANTAVSMKTTITTNVDNWLASAPIKKNIEFLEQGWKNANGLESNGMKMFFNNAEIHIYMPKANITSTLRTEWMNKLNSVNPKIKFEIKALEDFIQ